MTLEQPNEFMFSYHLFEYHLRREQALGFDEPSPLLHSIVSALLFEASTRFIEAAENMKNAEELYQTIVKNREKVERLTKKIEKSNSEARINTWYSIILRLKTEAEDAAVQLEAIEHGQ